jgi:hypothetical protein
MSDCITPLLARLLTEAKIEVNDARVIGFEIARLRKIEEAAREGLVIFADGDGHSTDYVDHQWRCTPDCPACRWIGALRAALGEEP